MLVELPKDHYNMDQTSFYTGEFEDTNDDFAVFQCPEDCGAKFSDPDLANTHARKTHHKGGARIQFYYLVRHVKAGTSPDPAIRQFVCHGKTEKDVENHLERVQRSVQMPSGCTYSIEHF